MRRKRGRGPWEVRAVDMQFSLSLIHFIQVEFGHFGTTQHEIKRMLVLCMEKRNVSTLEYDAMKLEKVNICVALQMILSFNMIAMR